MIYKTMKPFVHEVTLAKFKFLGTDFQNELLKNIDKDQIPLDYGGTGPSLDDITFWQLLNIITLLWTFWNTIFIS